jgi:hypothetical protein
VENVATKPIFYKQEVTEQSCNPWMTLMKHNARSHAEYKKYTYKNT